MNKIIHFFRSQGLLALLILCTYAPFMGSRLVRTAGDEKVYIAQAMEMKAQGNYFLQIIGGQPDYYKGPLHYILIQLGLDVFGHSLWAAIYMNLLFCLLGAFALSALVRKVYPKQNDLGLWAGAFLALNLGVSGHVFASQMEVELAGLYSVAGYFLWRGKGLPGQWKDDLAFWLLAGISGWVKSPVHSVLLGVSAILFWLWTGQLWMRVKDFRYSLCSLAGVVLGAAGYAPAFLLDQTNFIEKYYKRETLKPPNGGPWWQAIFSTYGYYLIPWMSVALIAYLENIVSLFKGKRFARKSDSSETRFFKWAVSGILPSTFFFTFFPYRGENYLVPVTAFVVGLVLYLLQRTRDRFPNIRKIIPMVSSLVAIGVAGLLTVIAIRFQVSSAWWPTWFLPLVWTLAGGAIAFQVKESRDRKSQGLGLNSVLTNVCIVILLNLVLFVFGQLEVYQLRAHLKADRSAGQTYKISYWNLNRLIWNEWALMSLAIQEPIHPLHTEAELLEAAQRGDLILGRDIDRIEDLKKFILNHFPNLVPMTSPWDRWKTHAQDAEGHSLVPLAWKKRDLSILFDHALIIRFIPRDSRGDHP